MREIIFRGKRVDNSEWVYGYYWTNEFGSYFIKTTRKTSNNLLRNYEVIPETVGQFIGKLDTNGNKIFEGDILNSRLSYFPYLVIYDECAFKMKDKHDNRIYITQKVMDILELEIVSNIYKHPKLLSEV